MPTKKVDDTYLQMIASMTDGKNGPETYGRKASAEAIDGENQIVFETSLASLQKLIVYAKTYYGETQGQIAIQQTQRLNVIIVVAVITGFLIALLLGIVLSRSITKPVVRIVNNLALGGSQIGNAANQLSVGAQQIASGASEQASGIEETTSSMEELSSMVKQNVDNSKEVSVCNGPWEMIKNIM